MQLLTRNIQYVVDVDPVEAHWNNGCNAMGAILINSRVSSRIFYLEGKIVHNFETNR